MIKLKIYPIQQKKTLFMQIVFLMNSLKKLWQENGSVNHRDKDRRGTWWIYSWSVVRVDQCDDPKGYPHHTEDLCLWNQPVSQV